MTKLEAKNIVKYFSHDSHKLKALGGVNLQIESGDFVCLVGPSGCGKSTFLLVLLLKSQPSLIQIQHYLELLTKGIKPLLEKP